MRLTILTPGARRSLTPLALSMALGLSACGGKPGAASSAEAAAAATPTVAASPATLKLYEQTCRNCHAVAASGAPQTGDLKAWAPRVAQGREILLDHSINGYKGMPPMGTCTQCTEADFVALIEYMSGTALK